MGRDASTSPACREKHLKYSTPAIKEAIERGRTELPAQLACSKYILTTEGKVRRPTERERADWNNEMVKVWQLPAGEVGTVPPRAKQSRTSRLRAVRDPHEVFQVDHDG